LRDKSRKETPGDFGRIHKVNVVNFVYFDRKNPVDYGISRDIMAEFTTSSA
jgi:hypothetical protein